MVAIIVAAAEGVAIANMRIPATRQATPSLSANTSRASRSQSGGGGSDRVDSRTWSAGSMGSAYSRLESVGEEDSDASRSSAERSSEDPASTDDATKRAVSVSVRDGRAVSDTAIKRGVGVWMG